MFASTNFQTDTMSVTANNLGLDPNATWMPESIPQLTVDMFRRGDMIYIVSTIAGVAVPDLEVMYDNNTLTIKGIRNKPYIESEVDSQLSECFWGGFYREIPITETINSDKIEAALKDGILTIQIPIIRATAKKIQVKNA
jgi:HSP20 family protein